MFLKKLIAISFVFTVAGCAVNGEMTSQVSENENLSKKYSYVTENNIFVKNLLNTPISHCEDNLTPKLLLDAYKRKYPSSTIQWMRSEDDLALVVLSKNPQMKQTITWHIGDENNYIITDVVTTENGRTERLLDFVTNKAQYHLVVSGKICEVVTKERKTQEQQEQGEGEHICDAVNNFFVDAVKNPRRYKKQGVSDAYFSEIARKNLIAFKTGLVKAIVQGPGYAEFYCQNVYIKNIYGVQTYLKNKTKNKK